MAVSAKKPTALFRCAKCDAQFLKWAGRCTECGAWSSLTEEQGRSSGSGTSAKKPQAFAALATIEHAERQPTHIPLWDRLLSGGLVPGSVTLLGGEPGIGKSTLLAQLGLALANAGKRVLYVAGEESPFQIALRLRRLSPVLPPSLEFFDDTDANAIADMIEREKPALTIVDSIQTMRLADVPGEVGNPSQVKACSARVTEAAKHSHAPVMLVGQVTKDGELAGPRLVEHLVDTVMMLEGDRSHALRLLRVLKHRFGVADELAALSMTERGLEEVLDPSAAMIADRPTNISGSLVSCLAEGSRPLLVELQALVSPAGYGTPMRRSSGIDLNRLNLLLAVLGRRTGIGFGDQDVFVNVVGGVEAKEPGADLGIALALASAKFDVPIAADVVAWGEMGLSGELRPVSHANARLKEAHRLGFKIAIVPVGKYDAPAGLQIKPCATLKEAIERLK